MVEMFPDGNKGLGNPLEIFRVTVLTLAKMPVDAPAATPQVVPADAVLADNQVAILGGVILDRASGTVDTLGIARLNN